MEDKMSFISRFTKFTKINVGYDRWEEFELAPGLKCTIRFEANNIPEVVDRFLRRKASIGELRQTLKGQG
jgi:hypothetical protein